MKILDRYELPSIEPQRVRYPIECRKIDESPLQPRTARDRKVSPSFVFQPERAFRKWYGAIGIAGGEGRDARNSYLKI